MRLNLEDLPHRYRAQAELQMEKNKNAPAEKFNLNVDPRTGEIVEESEVVKMTIRVILKNGAEFAIKCDKFTLTRNSFQQVTGYNIEGITENKPIYLDFEQVAAVVRVFSDEKGG